MDSNSGDKTTETQHPDRLFDYLNGTIDELTQQQVGQHISDCSECSAIAELVRALKGTFSASSRGDETESGVALEQHPDVSELAELFYGKTVNPRTSRTAAHLATCRKCADDVAEYARADRAAAEYEPGREMTVEVPAKAWELIREWEESSFAQPKTLTYPTDQARAAMLTRLLSEQRDKLQSMVQESLTHSHLSEKRADLVPVVIVDQAGAIRGVEVFERDKDPDGNEVLRHPARSEHFHRKAFHAVLDFGEEKHVVVSEYVRRHKILLPKPEQSNTKIRRADYFIIED